MSTHELPPLDDAPRVTVVIPAKLAAATLLATVQAALQPEVHHLVLAVDPSDIPTWDVAEGLQHEYPERVSVIRNDSGRTPDALNAAIRATDGQVIVRVDAHALLPSGYVRRAIETLRATGAANVGGRQEPVARGGFGRAVAAAMTSPLGAGGAAYRTGSVAGPVDTVYLGVFRREALEAVGGFDPRFTRNQDAELNIRLRRAGFLVWFAPELVVAYRPRDTPTSLARQYFEYGRWRRLTARVHRGSLAKRQLAPPALLGGLAVSLVMSGIARDVRPTVLATSTYLGLVVGAAASARPGLRFVPAVTVALSVMHVSWGLGFLIGPPGPLRLARSVERRAPSSSDSTW
jgi:succinoglycan biosynthesis protein ExoA